MSETKNICEAADEQDQEDHCCGDQYSRFLDPLSMLLRRETRNFLHDLSIRDADCADGAKEKCKDLILKIEAELGQGHMICELITQLMAERLRRLDKLDDAIELVKDRMERMKTEDFGGLLTLSRLYNLSGDYTKSQAPIEKALQIAKKAGDELQQCLALAKLSCVQWHLQNISDSRSKLDLCLYTLKECDEAQKEIHLPLSDAAHRLIDIYKTVGYNYRLYKDYQNAAEYYLKALKIVEMDDKAVIQLTKLETQLGCDFSLSDNKPEARKYCLRAYDRMKELSKNEVFAKHHPLTIIHTLARSAYSLEMVERNKEVLELREFLCGIAEKYLTENHPETARLTADCAYLCNHLHQYEKEEICIAKAQAALEVCGNQTDINYIKTHVRELSDAWHILGKLYLSKECFEKSERCFLVAVALNTRVYGSSHPRLGRLQQSLGYLYKRFDKFSEALESFRKCKEITEEFNPLNQALLRKLTKEITIVSKLDKKKYSYF